MKLVNRPAADGTDTARNDSQWNFITGSMTDEGRIYVPEVDNLRGTVIILFHDNSMSGHFGAPKTTELVSREFYWPAMDLHVRRYVSGCNVCH
jgi:hypothetical protein